MDIPLGRQKKRSRIPFKGLLVLLLLGGLGAGALITFRTGDRPTIKIASDLPAIGKRTRFTIEAAEPTRGLTSLKVEFVQGARVEALHEKTFTPQAAWNFWGPKSAQAKAQVEVGSELQKGLKIGPAIIRVSATAAGTWLFSPEPIKVEKTMEVRLTPPSIEVTSSQTYASQGGCEVVRYTVGETAVRDGVVAGRATFPGYPYPGGGPQERFAIFAVPFDMDSDKEVKVFAVDEVGNELQINFVDLFKAKPFKTDTIPVSDRFMGIVVPKIMAKTPGFTDRGSLLKNYVAINSELRKKNDQRLQELAKSSERKFYWNKSFVQMKAKVVSSFADRRTYRYKDRTIDKQDHLGFDLASTKKAPIPASNAGKVVLAEYFGIYGNAVVLDHGYGLMSLYGHLSSIDVKVGQKVGRGETIGATGATGLALGDHLHFTMLLHGLPVSPLEWWDGQWIRNRIAAKLGDALGFAED